MLGAQTIFGMGLAGAGLMTLCGALADIDARLPPPRWHSDRLHPVAALAWAQSNCDSSLTIPPGTPRLQAEDLVEMTARFDSIERQLGRPLACAKAMRLAAEVSADPREPEAESAEASGTLASAN